jgi:hypothetical protein
MQLLAQPSPDADRRRQATVQFGWRCKEIQQLSSIDPLADVTRPCSSAP